MAVFSARGAPVPEGSALVAEPQSQELVQRSLTLTEKIMQDIEDTHKSCVTVKVCRTALAGWLAGWLVFGGASSFFPRSRAARRSRFDRKLLRGILRHKAAWTPRAFMFGGIHTAWRWRLI